MTAKSLLDLMQCGASDSANIDSAGRKRMRSMPPTWSGIPLKRRKLSHGPAFLSENPSSAPYSVSQEGLGYKSAGSVIQHGLKGQLPPSAWPYLYGNQCSDWFHSHSSREVGNRQHIIDQMARRMVDSMAGLGYMPRVEGPGFPGRYGKKWQPRGWVPTVNGVRDPRRPVVDTTKGTLVEEHEKINRSGAVDLCVTGTSGCIAHESSQELVKPMLERAAARIVDKDVLAQFGLNCKDTVPSDRSPVDYKNMDLPWFDLSTSETDFLAGSEQVPSSASEFSLDFDSPSGTLPIIEYTSTRQDFDKSIKPSEKSKESKAVDKESSQPSCTLMSQKSVDQGVPPSVKCSSNTECLAHLPICSPLISSSRYRCQMLCNHMSPCAHAGTQEQQPASAGNGKGSHHHKTSADSETKCPIPLRGAGNKANCDQPMPLRTNKGENQILGGNVSQLQESFKKYEGHGQTEEHCLPSSMEKRESPVDDNGIAENCTQDIVCRHSTPVQSNSAAVHDHLCKKTGTGQDWNGQMRSFDQRIEVSCSQCNRRCHLGCLMPDQVQPNSPWFCSQGCHDVSWHLAELNCRGLMQVKQSQ